MRRTLLTPLLGVLLALGAASASFGSGSSASLSDDPQLQAKVTLQEADRPLGELLPDLAGPTGTRLRSGRETADDQVTLFVRERPAAEVLARMAKHLGFRWDRAADGYVLNRDPEAARGEVRLRDREWDAIRTWMEHLREVAKTPIPQLAERRTAVEAALARSDGGAEERAALLREDAALRDIFRYPQIIPLMLEVYHNLTPLQLRQLRATGSVRLCSAFGGLNPRLLGEAAAILRPNHPADQPLYVDVLFRATDSPREFQRGGTSAPRQVRLEAFFTVAGDSGSTMINSAPRSLVDVPLPDPTPPGVRRDDARLDREISWTVPKAMPVEAPSQVLRDQLSEWSAPGLPLSGIARRIHESTGLDVIADSYVRARVPLSALGKTMPARAVLDGIAATLGYSWWIEDDILFLRSHCFHNDRPAQVPLRIRRAWETRVAGKDYPSFDDFSDLALQVTDAQARGLTDYWGWYFADPPIPSPAFSGSFYAIRYDLRFWGSLQPRQKRWVLTGNPLSVQAMDFHQRLQYLLALTEPPEAGSPGDELRRIPPRPPVPSAGSLPPWTVFRVATRELELQVYTDDHGNHQTELRTPGTKFRFDPNRGQLTSLGEASQADDLTLTYDISGNGSGSRFFHYYLLQ